MNRTYRSSLDTGRDMRRPYSARLSRVRGEPGDDRFSSPSGGRMRQQRNTPAGKPEGSGRGELDIGHGWFLPRTLIHAEAQSRGDLLRGAGTSGAVWLTGAQSAPVFFSVALREPFSNNPKHRKTAAFQRRLRSRRNSRIGKNVRDHRYGVKLIGKIICEEGNLA